MAIELDARRREAEKKKQKPKAEMKNSIKELFQQ